MNTKSPKVTVMIPTFNQADCLLCAVESVMSQDYQNLEIIISDDCSVGKTQDIINSCLVDPRVIYVKNSRNLGRTANYRKCLYEYATGEWVLNLDGDDFLTNNSYISYAMKTLINIEESLNVVIIGAGETLSFLDGKYYDYQPVKNIKLLAGFEVFTKWFELRIPHLSALYKREVACKIGFYSFNIVHSDAESILRILLHGNVLLLPVIAGCWNEHDNNASREVNVVNNIDDLYFIKKMSLYALEEGYDESIINKWEGYFFKRSIDSILAKIFINGKISVLITFCVVILKKYPRYICVLFSPKNILKLLIFKNKTIFVLLRKKWMDIKYNSK